MSLCAVPLCKRTKKRHLRAFLTLWTGGINRIPPLAGENRAQNRAPGGIWASKVAKSDKTVIFAQNDVKQHFRTLFSTFAGLLGVLRGFRARFAHLFQDILVPDPSSGRPESDFLDEVERNQEQTCSQAGISQASTRAQSWAQGGIWTSGMSRKWSLTLCLERIKCLLRRLLPSPMAESCIPGSGLFARA